MCTCTYQSDSARLLVIITLLMPLSLCLTGCGSSLRAGDRDSVMQGVALELRISDGARSNAMYRIHPDGELEFAGGFAAMRERPEWTGAITREEADALIETLRSHGWFDAPPSSGEVSGLQGEDTWRHTIRLAWPEGEWTLEGVVGGGDIVPVREHVQNLFGEKRHRETFQKLPTAGPRN